MTSRRWLALAAVLSVVASACAGPPVVSPSPSTGAVPSVGVSSASPVAAGSVSPSSGPPPACEAAPAPSPGTRTWWLDAVFYEVFVRSFADSDGDGIGDLRGLTDRLDALNDGNPDTHDDLGVTALWLMPVAESPSYHGYDVTDYRTVEPDYGTNEDFRALVAAAEERGIRVIVDLVLNHSSVEHPWFQDARTRGSEHEDWYVWADTRPAVSGPAGAPVWHPDGDRFYYGYFWEGMPDLNLRDAAATNEVRDIAAFWLDEMGAAGFRLDAARHLIEDRDVLANTPETMTWLRDFRTTVQRDDPTALVLGEVWDATSSAARYVNEDALDLAFEFGLAGQFLSAVRFGDPASLALIQAEVTQAYPRGGYASFLTNHDQDRTFDVLGRDVAAARQAATLLLTSPGVPFIYYGEEIGLRGRKPDERIRTPLPWTGAAPGFGFTTGEPWEAMAEDVATTNVAAQTDDAESLLSRYRDLIALRAAHPALSPTSAIVPLETTAEDVYAILRHDPVTGEGVFVISNLGTEPATGVTLSLANGPLCGTPDPTVLLGVPSGDLPTPTITQAGGFTDWPIGDLAPHDDLILRLGPPQD